MEDIGGTCCPVTDPLVDQRIAEVKEVISNEKNGFTKLVELHGKHLHGIVRRILRNYPGEVDDVLQNVYLKIYKNLGQFKEQSKLSTWLYTIASREALMFLRSQTQRKVRHTLYGVNLDDVTDSLPDPHTLLKMKRDMLKVEEILLSFREKIGLQHRKLLQLWLEGYTLKEIASEVYMPVGTVRSFIFRSQQKMRKIAGQSRSVDTKNRVQVVKVYNKSLHCAVLQLQPHDAGAP